MYTFPNFSGYFIKELLKFQNFIWKQDIKLILIRRTIFYLCTLTFTKFRKLLMKFISSTCVV